jgi:UDP-N-acetylglucosamine--N-acetylmuramyl-(pentapeptide) pyrophosphoryl-undecaprenol N-acetylglucosamine transferase
VAEDHHTKNAMALVNGDAAQMIKDNTAVQVLVPAALKLLQDSEKQEIYRQNIAKLAKPDAAKEIARAILEIIEKRH